MYVLPFHVQIEYTVKKLCTNKGKKTTHSVLNLANAPSNAQSNARDSYFYFRRFFLEKTLIKLVYPECRLSETVHSIIEVSTFYHNITSDQINLNYHICHSVYTVYKLGIFWLNITIYSDLPSHVNFIRTPVLCYDMLYNTNYILMLQSFCSH